MYVPRSIILATNCIRYQFTGDKLKIILLINKLYNLFALDNSLVHRLFKLSIYIIYYNINRVLR